VSLPGLRERWISVVAFPCAVDRSLTFPLDSPLVQHIMRKVDTHQHLWDLELFRYSWLDSFPTLNRSFRIADYLEAADGLEVLKTVHLEADVDEPYMLAETQHLLKLADRPDNPLDGVVACARPEHETFRSYLDNIVGH